jgi:ADP-dependent NAD(P)H-hydrate dehydratase / NAD(P)H-hydrate epimerase
MTLRARDPRFFEPLWTGSQARALEFSTIEEVGISGYVLMEHAGRAVADAVTRLCAGKALHPVLIFTGFGNNGGDGWVAARHLWSLGVPTLVVSVAQISDLKGDALLAAQNFQKASVHMDWALPGIPIPWQTVNRAKDIFHLMHTLQPHVVVDALVGTGLNRSLEAPLSEWVLNIRQGMESLPSRPKIVAVDIPSGMFTQGPQGSKTFLEADVTVTFGGRKLCHAVSPTTFDCGEVIHATIGLLPSVEKVAAAPAFALRENISFLKNVLPQPSPTAHKGSFGHVGVWVGSNVMQGAAHLAALGAQRSASGKVTLFGSATEITGLTRLNADILQAVMPTDMQDAMTLLKQFSALVVGPGLPETKRDLKAAMQLIQLALHGAAPVVVDAGALQALSGLENASITVSSKGLLICTPHPKEAARLLGISTEQVQADRLTALKQLCALPINSKCKVIWVLKGACPMVGEQQSAAVVIRGGHAALAVAGSGDVLAGVLAALVTRVPDPFMATVAAALAHQKAGALLETVMTAGHTATEIAQALQRVLYATEDASQ